jgi:hypothetical protein
VQLSFVEQIIVICIMGRKLNLQLFDTCRLMACAFVLRCFACEAISVCGASNNLNLNVVQTALDSARSTCNADLQRYD